MKPVLTVVLFACFATRPIVAQDPVKIRPDNNKVQFENEKVRIFLAMRGPFEKFPMHSHQEYVAVYLTNVDLRITTADGVVRENHRKKGEVLFVNPVTH